MKTFPLKMPDELHYELRNRAYKKQMSLHEYVIELLFTEVEKPPAESKPLTEPKSITRRSIKTPLSKPSPRPIMETETETEFIEPPKVQEQEDDYYQCEYYNPATFRKCNRNIWLSAFGFDHERWNTAITTHKQRHVQRGDIHYHDLPDDPRYR